MFSPPPKCSFLIDNIYRPKLDKNDFQVSFKQDKFIQYRNRKYAPVVIHFPGSHNNRLHIDHFLEKMDDASALDLSCPDNLHIIQINNYSLLDKYKNCAEYFLTKAGLPYTSLGKNINSETWKNSLKIKLLYDFLDKIQVENTPQYFLFFDSADAILTGDPGHLIGALEEYNCHVLFGMDGAIFNGYSCLRNLIKTPQYMQTYVKTRYRFLNSGMIFGRVDSMKKILSFLLDAESTNGQFPHKSDQHYYHSARFDFLDDIQVDYKKKYLLNIMPFISFFERYQS